ncbi:MAG: hypothetical protein V3U75_09665 [Methylococcaceae bacterium]
MTILQYLVKRFPYVLLLSLLSVEASHAVWVTVGSPSFGRLCPEHVGGDREYAGHGPEVTISTELYTQNSGRDLYVNIEMHQIETRPDYSEVLLSRNFRLYRAPRGSTIIRILNSDVSDLFYIDNDHTLDRFFPSDNLVLEYRVNGDTRGKDIGNCTFDDAYLSVFLKQIRVDVE